MNIYWMVRFQSFPSFHHTVAQINLLPLPSDHPMSRSKSVPSVLISGKVLVFRSPGSPASPILACWGGITRDVGDSGDLMPPLPLPGHPTSSQVIPDWRGLQRSCLDWRRVPFAPPTPTPYVHPISPKVTQGHPSRGPRHARFSRGGVEAGAPNAHGFRVLGRKTG
jgi:hypothetical protein